MASVYHAGFLPPTANGRKILAGRSTDQDLLHELAQDPQSWVRKPVAYNLAAAPRTVALLMADSDPKIRWAAAKRVDAPVDRVAALVTDSDEWMRRLAAEDKRLPFAVVAPLATDPDAEVRKAIAWRDDCSVEVLRVLADDTDPRIRYAAANQIGRKGIEGIEGGDDAAALAQANEFTARAMTRKRPDGTFPPLSEAALLAGAQHPDYFTRLNIADRPDLPASVLLVLLEDSQVETRRRAARHPNADDTVRIRAVLDRAETVAMQVYNRNDGHEWMLAQPDPRVRLVAARVISCTASAFDRLLADPDPVVRVAAVKAATDPQAQTLADDPDPRVRAAIAAKTRSASVLTRLAEDPQWRVRKAVAASRYVPQSVLSVLADDAMPSVAKAAAERFLKALTGQSV